MYRLQPAASARYLKRRRAHIDHTLLALLVLLLMFGLLTLFSATYYKALKQGDVLLEVKRQLIGIGLIFNLDKKKTDELYAAMAAKRQA